MTKKYIPFTAIELADALSLCDFIDSDEADGNRLDIAQDMLAGVVAFEERELVRMATFKGLTVEELIELEPALTEYRDPEMETRKAIAEKLLTAGYAVEIAVEMCGLPVTKVKAWSKR
jgi:hypothetical protein